jgi:glucose 1-dehydrogenase
VRELSAEEANRGYPVRLRGTVTLGPGFIRTPLSEWVLKHPAFAAKYENLIPLRRIGVPEDVAGPAAFLASRGADFVNGVLLFVDGGQLA